MDSNKKYITDITAADLAELSAISKMRQGFGISLRKDKDGWVIELDIGALKILMSQLGVAWGEIP